MSDVRDISTDALRELAVLATGETASDDDATYAMTALNRLVDQWAAERLMIYTVTRTTFTIAASTQDYSVGSGSTIDVIRPVRIDHVTFSDSAGGGQEIPLTGPITDDAWAALPLKSETGAYPSLCYYNPTFSTGTLSLWPIPTSSTLTGVLYAPQQVAEFTSLSQAISLPPGYRRLLTKNLAVELAPSYEKEPSASLLRQAMDSKMVVQRANAPRMDMSLDPAVLPAGGIAYDINTDQ